MMQRSLLALFLILVNAMAWVTIQNYGGKKRLLNLFVQKVEQADAEGKADLPLEMVKVLEWNPGF